MLAMNQEQGLKSSQVRIPEGDGGGDGIVVFIDFFHVSEHSKHFSIHLYIYFFNFIFKGFSGDGRGGRTGTLESKDHGLRVTKV